MFSLSSEPLCERSLVSALRGERQDGGALVQFSGIVRDHNEGKSVESLEYEAYPELAIAEGQRICQEAMERFSILKIL